MKWYFAVSAASLARHEHDWPGLLQAAVTSAARNTTLRPHLLYDGEPNALTDDLARRGVTIVPHRATLFPALVRHADRTGRDPVWLAVAAGAFLRFDIPLIEQSDSCVLYTDADVLFLNDPNFFREQPPRLFAASTESSDRYEDMNSGVMLLNVPAMRADHERLCAFAAAHLDLGLDQEILRAHYTGRYDLLDRSLNWKPYWGSNPDAQIVHFHGPKPILARRFLREGYLSANSNWQTLLLRAPDGYRTYLQVWDQYADADRVLCTVDAVRPSLVAGWAVYRRDASRRVEFKVLIDGEDDGSIVCDQRRPDVAQAGFGSARAGWRYCPPPVAEGAPARRLELIEAGGLATDLVVEGRPANYCLVPSGPASAAGLLG